LAAVGDRVTALERILCGLYVLKRRKLKRGNLGDRRGEKSPRTRRDGIVLGKTLKSRQAHGRIDSFSKLLDRRFGEKHLELLNKGDEGMSVSQ
jgi:hypothetical protein